MCGWVGGWEEEEESLFFVLLPGRVEFQETGAVKQAIFGGG